MLSLKSFLIKVIVDRLRPIMKHLISPHQNSFLPGRSTLDNIILTQEVMHGINKRKGKKGVMIVKMDLHKTYDNVDWDFLGDTLRKFKFRDGLIKLLMFTMRESNISILWNGEKLNPFKPRRGLKQGNSLAL